MRQEGEAVPGSGLVRTGRWCAAAVAAAAVVLLFPGAVPARSHAASGNRPPAFLTGEGAGSAAPSAAAPAPGASTLPAGFTDTTVFSGLTNPTNVRFASDGRVFVAEKSGLLLVFDSLADQTPTVVADLSSQVDDYWDRGLLGLALDPNFPTSPYVYLLYTADAPPGGTAPTWNDACPTPPGPTTDGCVVSGRIVRIQLSGDVMTGSPQALISDQWCQQFPSHSIGDLNFGPDGDLYASGGDGASFNYADYGQSGGSAGSPTAANPCGDPPAGAGGTETAPTAEGGALRSQSLRRPSGQPVLLNGSVIRINPTTGLAASGNPNGSSADANAKRIVAYGFRNPFRFTFRPGTSELWIGDVGWDTWEEIDRVPSPTTAPSLDFGWPCYEGNGVQPGYQSANLTLCTGLYSAGTATAPYYTYAHSDAVVSGDNCPTANGSSVTGDAFYSSGSYPAAYDGALIFADHTRNCIWAMLPGSNGLPDPTKLQLLVGNAGHPVDLEAGPGGDIFYADLEDGTIQRISYSAPGSGPTCSAGQFEAKYFNNMTLSGTPVVDQCESAIDHDWGTGSPAPGVNADGFSASWDGSFTFAAGTYTFSATADDGIRVYVDGTKVIDGWKDQSATTYTAPLTLTAGTHAVRVEYYDDTVDAVAKVSWQATSTSNAPPTAAIDTPASSLTYAVGDPISFSGHATDPEDGALPASALTWSLIIHHCPTPGNCHTHLVQTWTGAASGSFNAPDHGYPSYLELQLVATDSAGATSTTSVQLSPKTVNLTFASSPSGLSIAVDAAAAVTPFVVTEIVGSSNSISASTPQTLGGTSYTFSSWSDGGAATHNIVAPASAKTYTATFAAPAVAPANTALPTISGAVWAGATLTTSNGTWTGSQPISYTYQWLRCDSAGNNCTAISGATAATYLLRSADQRHRLRSRVTAQNSAASVSATSAATAAVR